MIITTFFIAGERNGWRSTYKHRKIDTKRLNDVQKLWERNSLTKISQFKGGKRKGPYPENLCNLA